MDEKEIESLIKQLKAQGLNEEEIMDTYYEAFKKGEMDRKDLEVLANALGYELDDDFKNDEHPDPAEDKPEGDVEGLDKEKVEDVKALKPGETKEEFKEKVEDIKEDGKVDEEKEWEEANKYLKA